MTFQGIMCVTGCPGAADGHRSGEKLIDIGARLHIWHPILLLWR